MPKKAAVKGSSVYVDPLLFWTNNETISVSFSRGVRALLGILATSAFVEGFLLKLDILCVHIDVQWVIK